MDNSQEVKLHLEAEEMHPHVAPHSCQYCKGIVLDLSRPGSSRITRQSPKSWINTANNTGLTLDFLTHATQNGCELFAAMSRLQLFDSEGEQTIGWSIKFDSATEHKPYVQFLQGAQGDAISHRYMILPLVGQRPEVEHLPTCMPPNLVPGSLLSMRRARTWIEECRSTHTICQTQHVSDMPLRVIMVGDDSAPQLRLVETPRYDNYAALSYCWGGDQLAKTITARYQSYRNNIDIDSLPLAIKDAVRITRGLGLPYLWVDALCIIQDDEDDKTRQIAMMQNIYKGATVVLAATCTTRSGDSFLTPRTDYRPIKLNASYGPGKKGEVLLAPTEMTLNYSFYRRAWTFQETALATRVLSYEKRGMRFYCFEMQRDDDPGKNNIVGTGGQLNRLSQEYLKEEHPRGWMRLAETYSSRHLTDIHDRLPALIAMTQAYSSATGVQNFLGGLWHEEVLTQLTWYSVRPDETKRAQTYVAPTWSWASLLGEIQFEGRSFKYMTNLEFDALLQHAYSNPHSQLSPFGRVSDGALVILARTKPLVWLNQESLYDDDDLHRDSACESRASPATRINNLNVSIDTYAEWEGQGEVELTALELCTFLDPIGIQGASGEVRQLGLLLVSVEGHGENKYRRVGIVRIDATSDGRSWFDAGSERKLVTIV